MVVEHKNMSAQGEEMGGEVRKVGVQSQTVMGMGSMEGDDLLRDGRGDGGKGGLGRCRAIHRKIDGQGRGKNIMLSCLKLSLSRTFDRGASVVDVPKRPVPGRPSWRKTSKLVV